MKNSDIERIGIDIVKKYETAAGRTIHERVQKCGYDLKSCSDDGVDERHIEIKTTAKAAFSSRWLEQLEQDRLEADGKFYMYLVVNCGTGNEKVSVLNGDSLKKRFTRVVKHYYYNLSDLRFE